MPQSDRRPRVLLVGRMTPRLNARTRRIAESLATECEITVLCERETSIVPETTDQVATECPCVAPSRLIGTTLFSAGVNIFHFAGLVRVLQMNWFGIKEGLRGRYDVVVCADAPYSLCGLLLQVLRDCRFVFDSQEIIWGMGDPWYVSQPLRLLERLILRNCDLWLVPSEDRGRLVQQSQGTRKAFVVVLNVPVFGNKLAAPIVVHEEQSSREARPTVIFQGSLLYRRGIESLIEAAADGGFNLILQGPGPLRQYCEERKRENITVIPACPNDEAVRWVGKANLSFIYYEDDCLNSRYACSNKLYVSALAGVPVICNRLPAFQSFADEYGGCAFIESLDPKEIANKVNAVWADETRYLELRRRMSLASRSFAAYRPDEVIRAAFRPLFSNT